MATAISSAVTTTAALYTEIKNTFTANGNWTNNLDTPPGADFFLEYTSANTIDGEAIKVHIAANIGSNLVTIGVYDSTATLRTVTQIYTGTTAGVKILVADDHFVIAPIPSSIQPNPCVAGKIFDIYTSPLTGRDNLGFGTIGVSGYMAIYRARYYNQTGTLVNGPTGSGIYAINPLAANSTVFLENVFVNSGPAATEKISLFPAIVSGTGQHGVLGTLRSDRFLNSIALTPTTTTIGNEFTIGGILYKRLSGSVSSAPSSFQNTVVKWQ